MGQTLRNVGNWLVFAGGLLTDIGTMLKKVRLPNEDIKDVNFEVVSDDKK